ncbi:MAG: hypothetical protein KatS3mg015_1191 [Fimbriimonadales bacterium]|nr:MAG: hypothetical protein KatS3mg015_1191 [Fimbriimonadales bacterium]
MTETILDVLVTPRANRTEVSVEGGVIRVRVPCPPADGEANRAVCEALAKTLRVPTSNLEIVRGEKSRRKTIRVRGMAEEDLFARLNPSSD